jgi:hypothetical protein
MKSESSFWAHDVEIHVPNKAETIKTCDKARGYITLGSSFGLIGCESLANVRLR